MRFFLFRRYRTSWCGHEWHHYPGRDDIYGRVTYLHVWVGHPRKHVWWATSLYIYLRGYSPWWAIWKGCKP